MYPTLTEGMSVFFTKSTRRRTAYKSYKITKIREDGIVYIDDDNHSPSMADTEYWVSVGLQIARFTLKKELKWP